MAMWDEVQRGWLDGDDYRVAAEAAGVVELPDGAGVFTPARAVAPAPVAPCPVYQQVLDDLDAQQRMGRWEDCDPPGTPA